MADRAVVLAAICALGGCESAPVTTLDLMGAVEKRAAQTDGFGGVSLGVHSSAEDTWWFQGAAGHAWVGGPAMSADDTFEIASITKTFTAAATLRLVEQGRLSLDDTLGERLPNYADGLLVIDGHDYGPEITVKQLLHQDSGLPDYWADPPFVTRGTNAFLKAFNADPQRVWTPAELIAAAAKLDPIGAPGEVWHYSDTNYVLLGLLLQAAEKKPYDAVIREQILGPLGLGDTWLTYHEQPTSDATESHRFEGTDDLFRVPRQVADWAGGGLVSSQRDLAEFIEALARGDVFDDFDTLLALLEAQPTDEVDVTYGLGVFSVDLGADGYLWGHDGYGGSFVYTWPQRGLTMVGTVNQTDVDWWPMVLATLRAVDAR